MITSPCDIPDCKTPSVHIVYGIRVMRDVVVKIRIRLCVHHFNHYDNIITPK